jgi:hypothetical protein
MSQNKHPHSILTSIDIQNTSNDDISPTMQMISQAQQGQSILSDDGFDFAFNSPTKSDTGSDSGPQRRRGPRRRRFNDRPKQDSSMEKSQHETVRLALQARVRQRLQHKEQGYYHAHPMFFNAIPVLPSGLPPGTSNSTNLIDRLRQRVAGERSLAPATSTSDDGKVGEGAPFTPLREFFSFSSPPPSSSPMGSNTGLSADGATGYAVSPTYAVGVPMYHNGYTMVPYPATNTDDGSGNMMYPPIFPDSTPGNSGWSQSGSHQEDAKDGLDSGFPSALGQRRSSSDSNLYKLQTQASVNDNREFYSV